MIRHMAVPSKSSCACSVCSQILINRRNATAFALDWSWSAEKPQARNLRKTEQRKLLVSVIVCEHDLPSSALERTVARSVAALDIETTAY